MDGRIEFGFETVGASGDTTGYDLITSAQQTDFRDAVRTEIIEKITTVWLNQWAYLTTITGPMGAFVTSELNSYNGGKPASDQLTVDEAETRISYVHYNNQRWCEHVFTLSRGGAAWEFSKTYGGQIVKTTIHLELKAAMP